MLSVVNNHSFEALDAQRIRSLIAPRTQALLTELTVLAETDSTNSALQALPADQQHAHAILAEAQTRGRGRRNRHWHSPQGCNVYLSLGWQFPDSGRLFSTLPLMVAVCACRALSQCGLVGHGIKWPNDILVNGAKLAGILVEMKATPGGPALAVIGVGVNVNMAQHNSQQQAAAAMIEQCWTDINSHIPQGSPLVSRNRVAAAVLESLLCGLSEYESAGFGSFQGEWSGLDLLFGQHIHVVQEDHSTSGIARGISADGGLQLEVKGPEHDSSLRIFHAGEVSVRRD